ncbi:MAG: biopolymer transporter ExbD [Gemmatimonadaceae bacterium]
MRSRRRREGLAVNGEINVVSLIDVMMLLMVIFMIAAPMMQSGIDVKLPEADAPPMDSKNAVTITVKQNGSIMVDQVAMSEVEFLSSIKAFATKQGKDGVNLQADGGVAYRHIITILDALTRNGIKAIGMQTSPIPEERK